MCHPNHHISDIHLRHVLLILGVLLLGVGCDVRETPPSTPTLQAPPVQGLEVLTPKDAGPFGPTLTTLRSIGADTPEGLVAQMVDPAACLPCHQDIAKAWAPSPHALSSFSNPLYRVAFEAFVDAKGREAAPFCGGCHDPALLLSGGLAAPIAPEDPRAHAGVGCALCHGALDASPEGNGSYTLGPTAIPLPRPGDALSLTAHRARVGMARELGDILCQSCHKGFLGPHTDHPTVLTGLDEEGPWRRSPYGGSTANRVDPAPPEGQGCIDCHMGTGGHAMAGGHTTLATMAGSPAQSMAIEAQLKGAASIHIVPIAKGPGGAGALGHLDGSEALAFDVVIVNEAVGHHFPGGARDLRDTWVEVEIRDKDGVLRAQAGSAYRQGLSDASVHRLGALVAGAQGVPETTHGVGDFRTAVFDHTIPPRDAAALRFAQDNAPNLGPGPHTLTARLLHRRLTPSFYTASCEAAGSPEGSAFLAGATAAGRISPKPCPDQPILTIDEATLPWAPGAVSFGEAPPWVVYYHHAQALSHQVQERLGECGPSIALAKANLAQASGAPPRAAAALLALEGKIAGMRGQTADALALFDAAGAILPESGALPTLKGQALAKVWRWPEAAESFEQALGWSPRHDGLWAQLAQAKGSSGERHDALDAAQRGLALSPRDPALLRSQMLALERLSPKSPEAKKAREAYLAYRPDDLAPEVRGRCGDASPDCLRERLPIHQHPLLPPLE